MLNYLFLEIKSVKASYRNAEFQNFHKSYILPPPTTIIGLMGAALGLDPLSIQNFVDEHIIYAGISGKSNGKSNDLWKYNDFKNGSVILRELLFNNHLKLVFACLDIAVINKLEEAFSYPVYAITLGPSDSLAKVINIEKGQTNWKNAKSFENVLVEGDLMKEVFENITHKKTDFSFQLDTRQAVSMTLPTRFEYESAYGVRRVSKKNIFSFIQSRMEFTNSERKGIQVNENFVHLFQL